MSEGRKITILGKGHSAMERRWDILRYCEGTEIWTLNDAYEPYEHCLDHVTRWFEIHSWESLKLCNGHCEELNKIGCPVYVSEPLPVINKQIVVDWGKVIKHFLLAGETRTNRYFGTPSLLFMLALYEHDAGDKIEMLQSYGIDTIDKDHQNQRPSWAYWCGQAHARGIRLGGTMIDFFAEHGEKYPYPLEHLRARP